MISLSNKFLGHGGAETLHGSFKSNTLKDELDGEIDQRDWLFQCLGRLERTARKAEESGNFACVIGAVQLMNRMMALGADQAGFRGHRPNGHYYRR